MSIADLDRETFFRLLSENSSRWDEWITPDGTLAFISPGCFHISGYTAEQFYQNPNLIMEILFPADLDILLEHRRRLQQGPFNNCHLEFRLRRADGSIGWVNHTCDAIFHPHSAAWLGQRASYTDITTLKQSVEHSQMLIQALMASPSDLVIFSDLQGKIILCSQNLARILHLPLEDLIGRCMWEIFPPPRAQFRKAIFDQVLASKQPVRVEDPTPNGIFDSTVYPILDSQGNITQMVILAHDITERKKIENALHESEQRMQTLLMNFPVLVSVLRADGLIQMVQGKFPSLDYDPQSLVGRNIYDFRTVWLKSINDFDRAVSGEYAASIIRTASGAFYDMRYSPVFNSRGEVESIIVVVNDVTEVQSARLALQEAHNVLEQRVLERTNQLAEANRELSRQVLERQAAELRARRQAERAQALACILESINANLDLQSVLQTICDQARTIITPLQGVSIMLYNPENDMLEPAAYSAPMLVENPLIFSTPRPVYELAHSRYGSIMVVPEISQLPYIANVEILLQHGIKSLVSAPMKYNDQLIAALLLVSYGDIYHPCEEDRSFILNLANQASVAIVRARMYEQVSRARDRLEALTNELAEIQETEQRRLARELHDEIGQQLTTLILTLEKVSRSVTIDHPEHKKALQELSQISITLDKILQQVRNLSLSLRPVLLDDLGLLLALIDHFDRISKQTGVVVDFRHSGIDRRFPNRVESATFRIIQEALTNIVRHAGVKQATVYVWAEDQYLGLKVEDHGKGFDLGNYNFSTGISSMRERAQLCHGYVEIETAPGEGTCVTAELMIQPSLSGIEE